MNKSRKISIGGGSLKSVHIVPNMFTSANLFLGMLAIIEISQFIGSAGAEPNHLRIACWFILGAALMDACDGKVARWLKAESEFGVHYDSLADIISFGAAPAFLIYVRFLRDIANSRLIALATVFATVIFVLSGALRLARFNVQRKDEESKHFTGLPIPAAACMVITTYLLLSAWEIPWLIHSLPLLMIALAFLMVSKIPYPSLKAIPLEKIRSFKILFFVVLIGVVFYALRDLKEIIVFALFTAYLAFGIAVSLHQRITGRKSALAEVIEDPDLLDQEAEDKEQPDPIRAK